jgi:hypothetical protein
VLERSSTPQVFTHRPDPQLPFGFSRLIWLATAVYLTVGLVAFAVTVATGNYRWVSVVLDGPGAILTVSLAVLQLWLSAMVCRQFLPGDALHATWLLIAFSAACDLAGSISVQVLGASPGMNLVAHWPGWPEQVTATFRIFGLIMGGILRLSLLAAGLFCVLRVYRRSGLLGRLVTIDRIVLLVIGAYVLLEAWDTGNALRHGKAFDLGEALRWPVDPLLWLLLAEAMLLARSVRSAGMGWIHKTWKAFSIGVLLMILGDIGLWATSYGYLQLPWSAAARFVWLPAAAAFAAAPACQLEAIRAAGADG